MKTQIIVNSDSSVTIKKDDQYSGERIERTYFVAKSDGVGYVHFYTMNGGTSQICERMASTGATLRSSRNNLADVLRRELRKQRADELKFMNS